MSEVIHGSTARTGAPHLRLVSAVAAQLSVWAKADRLSLRGERAVANTRSNSPVRPANDSRCHAAYTKGTSFIRRATVQTETIDKSSCHDKTGHRTVAPRTAETNRGISHTRILLHGTGPSSGPTRTTSTYSGSSGRTAARHGVPSSGKASSARIDGVLANVASSCALPRTIAPIAHAHP